MRGLYAIVDLTSLETRGFDPEAFAAAVLAARPAALQLRAKGASPRGTLQLLRRLLPMCRTAGVPLVCNDRPDLAALAGCDMVHVGQTDASPEAVRRIAPGLGVGISTHDLDELGRAVAAAPAYVAFGPVFETRSKETPEPVVGLAGLETARAACRDVPLVAIGGIGMVNAAEVATRADMGAVIAGLLPERWSADDVTARARALHARLGGAPARPAGDAA